jgi:hypothetical protein
MYTFMIAYIYDPLLHHLINSRVTKSITGGWLQKGSIKSIHFISSIYHLLFRPFYFTFNRTMASFPIQAFGTTT